MYLLYTMVISALRQNPVNANLAKWYASIDSDTMFLSVITIGEIQKGICLLEKKSGSPVPNLQSWLQFIVSSFAERILPVTLEVAQEWGNISCMIGNSGADNLIAATAKVNNLKVVTRNVKHFEPAGVPCVNPWENP